MNIDHHASPRAVKPLLWFPWKSSLILVFPSFSVPTVNIVEKETRESLVFNIPLFVVENQICLKDREKRRESDFQVKDVK